jgi:hypothetical protein
MQGPLVRFEKIPCIFSLLGVIPGVLCLIPLAEETFLKHLLKCLALKVSAKFVIKPKEPPSDFG